MRNFQLLSFTILIFSFCGILFVSNVYAETLLIGTSHGTSFDLRISDGIMSGNISWDDGNNSILENLKVITKHNKLFIYDNVNNLKIMLTKFSDTKYLMLIKSDNEFKLRTMVNSEISSSITSPPNQRNLFTASQDYIDEQNKLKTENQIFKEKQRIEKQTKLQRAQEIHNEQLDRLNEDNRGTTSQGFSSTEILENWQTWRDTSSTEFDTSLTPIRPESPAPIPPRTATNQNNNSGVSVFFNVPRHTEWNESFRYTILVTDNNAHRYVDYFKAYVGNELGNVSVTGKIINPQGQTMTQFQGVTSQNGIYDGSWLVPDGITTRGEYTIEAHATHLTDRGTTSTTGDGTKTFFVVAESNTNNARPISNAGLDIHNISGGLIALDGSDSSDVDDSVLFYTWTSINGTTQILTNTNTVNPTFTIPDVVNLFYFSLIVDDGRKSGVADTMIVSSLHSEAGTNQTQTGFQEIILDGSNSGDVLGHTISYLWSVLSEPPTSNISLSNNTAERPTFTPDVTGNYTLNLEVTDGTLTDIDFVGIEIK